MKKIPITRRMFTLVDDDDYEKFAIFRWHATLDKKRPMYIRVARKNKEKKTEYLHRVILDAPKGKYVDHINGNALDNRKINLRICTHSQNMMNRSKESINKSGFKGVCYCSQTGLWKSTISVNKKQIWLGRYKTKEEAHIAYIAAAKKFHGKFAKY